MATKTVIEYVQACLSTMDSDAVNSIDETAEAEQIANLLEDVYYELINRQEWDFLNSAVTLTSAGDLDLPTKFTIPDNVRHLLSVWYNIDEDGELNKRKLTYVCPEQFLSDYSVGPSADNKQLVTVGDQIQFYVRTDRMPTVFTSFDGKTLYCDAFKSSIDDTLVSSKISAFGVISPAFSVENDFTPLLPEHLVPLLQSSLNASAHLYFKQQVSQPDEARVKRQMANIRRRASKLTRENYYANQFGRR